MNETLTLNTVGGRHIEDVALKAVMIASHTGMVVDFKHNGVNCIAHPFSSPFDLAKMYAKSVSNSIRIPESNDLIYADAEAKPLSSARS